MSGTSENMVDIIFTGMFGLAAAHGEATDTVKRVRGRTATEIGLFALGIGSEIGRSP